MSIKKACSTIFTLKLTLVVFFTLCIQESLIFDEEKHSNSRLIEKKNGGKIKFAKKIIFSETTKNLDNFQKKFVYT